MDRRNVWRLVLPGALKPEKVYITHGEVVASDVMRKRIRDRFGWNVEVALSCLGRLGFEDTTPTFQRPIGCGF